MYHHSSSSDKNSVEQQITSRRPHSNGAELRREVAQLRQEVAWLKRHYQQTVRAAIDVLPFEARSHYLGLDNLNSQDELNQFLYDLRRLVKQEAELLPPRFPGDDDRVACPLCVSHARGPYRGRGDGWGAERGIDLHLQRDAGENGCHIMQVLREHAVREYRSREHSLER